MLKIYLYSVKLIKKHFKIKYIFMQDMAEFQYFELFCRRGDKM